MLALALSVLASACTPASAADSFSGLGRAKDGDSLMVDDREVRLFGIDAPEWDQSCTRAGSPWACGQEAAERLGQLVTGKQVQCTAVDVDEHGRTVARCSVGTTDVNRMMVSSGYAVAYRRYSMDYVSAEESAKRTKRGIWSGTFQMPSDVRHADEAPSRSTPRRSTGGSAPSRNRPVVQSISGGNGNCVIKGNRGSNGWIYHLPGMPYYSRTKAEEMFCTEAEARAAGYRRAKVR